MNSSLKDALSVFKVARYFSPKKIHAIQPDANAIDALHVFPFLEVPTDIKGLKEELPTYLAKVIDLDPKVECLDWWKQNESILPCWAHAARKVFLIQPSLAASERVFSLPNSSFTSQQQASLQDYIETSLILQYNYRK